MLEVNEVDVFFEVNEVDVFFEVNEVIEVIATLEVNDVTLCLYYLSVQRIVDNFVNSDNSERSDNFRKLN